MPTMRPCASVMWLTPTTLLISRPGRLRLIRQLLSPRCNPIAALYTTSYPRIPLTSSLATPSSNYEADRRVAVLPLDVIQRIASGEVLCDYASVVHELVENALDAHSASIHVDVDITTGRIAVSDDGRGIHPVLDLPHVALPNATSKLASVSELRQGVPTLGFRGQALWALAATAEHLSVSSRLQSQPHGHALTFGSDGTPEDNTATVSVPMAPGTVVVASGLPWQVDSPHRAAAFRRCRLVLLRVALANPHVALRLMRAARPVWQSSTLAPTSPPVHRTPAEEHADQPAANVTAAAAAAAAATLSRLTSTSVSSFRHTTIRYDGMGHVVIALALPSQSSASSIDSLVVAVNGRAVRLDSVSRAVANACSLPRGRYPIAFVGLHVAPHRVNWNVCPSKTRMRFHDGAFESRVVQAVQDTLVHLLGVSHGVEVMGDVHAKGAVTLESTPTSGGALLSAMQRKVAQGAALKNCEKVDGEQANVGRMDMFGMRVVAQVLNTYILVEHNGGIVLIEQHVADERAIYEGLRDCWRRQAFVRLANGIPFASSLSEEVLFRLSTLGFEFEGAEADEDSTRVEKDGAMTLMLQCVPDVLADLTEGELRQVVMDLGMDNRSVEDAAARVACRMAVKNGKSLDERRMKSIVKNLFACENAHTCPHGRPIFQNLQTKELAGLFGRKWTPERVGGEGGHGKEARRADKKGFIYGAVEER